MEREIIIIPDNFFRKIKEDNERLEKFGATPVSGFNRMKSAFEKAMSDMDNRLMTQANAKEMRTKKSTVKDAQEEK